jgi:hypothetical protein
MPRNSSASEPESDDEPFYGGPEMSVMRQVMNVTPGLRLFIREFRRATGERRLRG